MREVTISTDDPRAADVRELLERHLAYAKANTAREDVHSLDADSLLDPSVSLETGAGSVFAAARRLYASAEFTPCGPFADYGPSPNSAYMTLALDGLGATD